MSKKNGGLEREKGKRKKTRKKEEMKGWIKPARDDVQEHRG